MLESHHHQQLIIHFSFIHHYIPILSFLNPFVIPLNYKEIFKKPQYFMSGLLLFLLMTIITRPPNKITSDQPSHSEMQLYVLHPLPSFTAIQFESSLVQVCMTHGHYFRRLLTLYPNFELPPCTWQSINQWEEHWGMSHLAVLPYKSHRALSYNNLCLHNRKWKIVAN